jgi:CBS domain-containing protein
MDPMNPSRQVAGPLRTVAELRRIDRLAPLDGYQGEVLEAVRRSLASQADVLEVTQAVARANDALTGRLLELAEEALGPPPCRYSWLALGSHGRGEQVLSSDQDSALAYDGAVERAAAEEYFPALAELVVKALARAGLPLCAGDFMAPSWCRPIEEFASLFRGWVDRPEPEALLRAEVFLDVRPVHGDLDVQVLDRLLVAGGSRGPFRVQMARAATTFRPPLKLFGRLRLDRGSIDVKRAGTASIVLLARLYALAAGSPARTTAGRLEAAAAGGTLSRSGARGLTDTYEFLTGLRLRHQVEQVAAGLPADNTIPLDELPSEHLPRLRHALRGIRDVQQVTEARFATYTVT